MTKPSLWFDRSLIARVLVGLLGSSALGNGWELRIQERLDAATVRAVPGVALLDTLEALTLLPACWIATDLAVVSEHTSAVALLTPDRPDRLQETSVALGTCRAASEALARTTIEPFFGVRVREWHRGDQTSRHPELRLVEDEMALHAPNERHHDLGRAWFILTGYPFVSHVLVVHPEVPREYRSMLAPLLRRLGDTLRARAAEIASEVATTQAVDAGRLHAYLSEAVGELAPRARRAIVEIVRRSGVDLRAPAPESYRSLSS